MKKKYNALAINFLISVVAIALLSLTFIQLVLLKNDMNELINYSNFILKRSADITKEVRGLTHKISKLDVKKCLPSLLDELRYFSVTSQYVSDIGIVNDDAVKCTALLGVLPKPILLSKENFITKNGQRFWRSYNGIIDPRISRDMVEHKGVLLTITSSAFRDVNSQPNNNSALLTDRLKHPYKFFGDTIDFNIAGNSIFSRFFSGIIYYEVCDGVYDVCVISRDAKAGIQSLSLTNKLLFVMLSFFIAIICVLSVYQYMLYGRTLKSRLRLAIFNGDIHLHYQPFVSIISKRVVGYEALARWKTSSNDYIPPDIFIKIAEEEGLITDLTRLVIRNSLSEMSHKLSLNDEIFLSVNVTFADLLDSSFLSFLDYEVERYNFKHSQIVLEITERSSGNLYYLKDILQNFKSRGYRIAVDDFGTGFSNLEYLTMLPIDIVKIDKLFTDAIGTEGVGFIMFKNMIQMVQQLEIQIIVEGVEFQYQDDYLRENYTKLIGQGWLYGKPKAYH